jgi:hypothetical protein
LVLVFGRVAACDLDDEMKAAVIISLIALLLMWAAYELFTAFLPLWLLGWRPW